MPVTDSPPDPNLYKQERYKGCLILVSHCKVAQYGDPDFDPEKCTPRAFKYWIFGIFEKGMLREEDFPSLDSAYQAEKGKVGTLLEE